MNKLAYRLFNKKAIADAQMPRALELRGLAGLSLSTHRDGSPLVLPPDLPEACAMSTTFIPQPADWPEFKEMVGYWMMAPTTNFRPPKELVDFLKSGDAP
eukprot:5954799-Prymnesium_polylepis.1